MSHDDFYKDVFEKEGKGISSTPFFINTYLSSEEQSANAKLIMEKAEIEKEKRIIYIWKRRFEGFLGTLILEIALGLVFYLFWPRT